MLICTEMDWVLFVYFEFVKLYRVYVRKGLRRAESFSESHFLILMFLGHYRLWSRCPVFIVDYGFYCSWCIFFGLGHLLALLASQRFC